MLETETIEREPISWSEKFVESDWFSDSLIRALALMIDQG